MDVELYTFHTACHLDLIMRPTGSDAVQTCADRIIRILLHFLYPITDSLLPAAGAACLQAGCVGG